MDVSYVTDANAVLGIQSNE